MMMDKGKFWFYFCPGAAKTGIPNAKAANGWCCWQVLKVSD